MFSEREPKIMVVELLPPPPAGGLGGVAGCSVVVLVSWRVTVT